MCSKIAISDIVNNSTYKITLQCKNEETLKLGSLGLSEFLENDQKNMKNCLNSSYSSYFFFDSTCDLSNLINNKVICSNSYSKCELQIRPSDISTNCKYNSALNKYLYLSYSCIPAIDNLNINHFLYYEVIIDGASTLLIFLSLCLIYINQNKLCDTYWKKFVDIESYTVLIKGLKIGETGYFNYLSELISHINRVIDITHSEQILSRNLLMNGSKSMIYEVNHPIFSYKILTLLLRKEQLFNEIDELIILYKDACRINSECKIAHELKNKIIELKKRHSNIIEKIKNCEDIYINLKNINRVYVTFKEINIAKKFIRIYKSKTLCIRICLILCCKKERITPLYFKNKWLDLEINPESPQNIRWENFDYSYIKKLMRNFFTLLITFLLTCCSLLIFLLFRNSIINVDKSFNSNIGVECSDISYNSTIIDNNDTVTQCFCMNMYFTEGFNVVTNYFDKDTNINPCKSWAESYSNFMIINYLTIAAIPLLNLFSRVMIKTLIQIEKNDSITEDKISLMNKLSFLTLFNIGISVIIMNSFIPISGFFDNSFPILNGLFIDFGKTWYMNIGTIITFAMIINIFEPHLVNIFYFLFYFFKRIIDSGNMNGVKSKVPSKRIFYKLYLGPEIHIEIRYANIISSFYVCYFYSSAIPLMYPILFSSLIISFWSNNFFSLILEKITVEYNLILLGVAILILVFLLIKYSCWEFLGFFIVRCCDNKSKIPSKIDEYIKSSIEINDIDEYQKNEKEVVGEKPERIIFEPINLDIRKQSTFFKNEDVNANLKINMNPITLPKTLTNYGKNIEEENFNIYEALPLNIIYKNYTLRKLQYLQASKLALELDVRSLIGMIKKNIDNDRRAIKIKYGYIIGLAYDENEDLKDFDRQMKPILDNFEANEEAPIKKDFSYNLAYVSAYESYLYNHYLKN